jgi:Flp pilus assembly protein TadG
MAPIGVSLRRLRRSERGAELVEFALAFPLLLLVVMGIIDFGLMFQQYEVITNAAREGARVGVLPGYTKDDAQARAQAYVDAALLSGSSSATVATPTYGTALVNGKCVTTITVQVSYPHNYLFLSGVGQYFGASFSSKTLTAVATMRTESPIGTCP